MSSVTQNVSEYIRRVGINIAQMSRDTGIPYTALYDSLANDERDRDLRDQEFLTICMYVEKNPMEFAGKDAS